MPRRRLDPTLRFGDVVPVWNRALEEGGGIISTPDDNATIALVYRLNQYRKAVREEAPNGWTDLDRYIVKRGDLCVHIEPRITTDLVSRMTRLDGSPLPVRELKPSPLDHAVPRLLEEESDLSAEQRKLLEESAKLKPSPTAGRIKP